MALGRLSVPASCSPPFEIPNVGDLSPSALRRPPSRRSCATFLALLAAVGLPLPTCYGAGRDATAQTGIDWPLNGHDGDERHFSPAQEIDVSNVSQLGLEWALDLPEEGALEATPLEVDGTIFFSGSMGVIYAVDAVTGKLRWSYDPASGPLISYAQRMIYPVNRGVAYLDGKVFVATRDGRMVAVDAKTGKKVWETRFLIEGDKSTSTGAPRIAEDLILIGNSGAEANARGYVTALQATTGKIAWRFFVVPGPPGTKPENPAMEVAAKTWRDGGTKYGGGGTPWNAIVYDSEFHQVLIGTGNGSPYVGKLRGTDRGLTNLFLASVVAVDPKRGVYKWHYQYSPGEVWDHKATMDIILADLTIDNRPRKVLLQSPSNGFFYVIDRSNGKLISAEKTGKVNWATRIDLASGKPVEDPAARYEQGPAIVYPGVYGAHNWQPMAYNPQTGLVYIPYIQIGTRYWPDKSEEAMLDTRRPGFWNTGVKSALYIDRNDPHDGKGALLAWDPLKQHAAWTQWHNAFWNGGVLTTRGNLVFQGLSTGEFVAYDASDGKQMWQFSTQMGIVGAPISYAISGKQYVAILAGYGGAGVPAGEMNPTSWSYRAPRRLLTFALGGRAVLPESRFLRSTLVSDIIDPPEQGLDPAVIEKGSYLWSFSCIGCHGPNANSTGGAPDLRSSATAANEASFRAVLQQNTLVSRGMPRFDDLTDAEVASLFEYIRSEAHKAKSEK